MADVRYTNCFLTKKERDRFIGFITKYNILSNGNTSLLTKECYDIFSKLGTTCSYISSEQGSISIPFNPLDNIVGTILGVVTTLNIGKTGYVSYLCFKEEYRGKGYTLQLCENLIKYGTTLGVNFGYFLGSKPRRETSYRINAFYRIIDITTMKNAGFHAVPGKRGKLKYLVREDLTVTVEEGINEKMQRYFLDSLDSCKHEIYWNPDPMELKRYTGTLDFFTVYYEKNQIGFFILTPIETIIGETGLKVRLAMLSYCYMTSKNTENLQRVFRAIIYTASCKKYHGLYGYIIGNVTKELAEVNGCHIPERIFYLNFFNYTGMNMMPNNINVLLF
jgi:hypothetical protein